MYRHSYLNFGHLRYLQEVNAANGMSPEERAWLQRAAGSMAVETVLKQGEVLYRNLKHYWHLVLVPGVTVPSNQKMFLGEVLYIPSYWFHYIISLQKSAQCNVRSGVDAEQHRDFGGQANVLKCVD